LAVALGMGVGTASPAIQVSDAPSGASIDLIEVLVDEVSAETWLRFRFLAPSIARESGSVSFAQIEQDFEYLCQEVALPYLARHELEAEVVVVSLLDRPVAFGAADPEATQYIDVFRVSSGTCEWEGL
jgi:hypothetical protein